MCLGEFVSRLFAVNTCEWVLVGIVCCGLGFVIVCIEVRCFEFGVLGCDLLVGLGWVGSVT